MSLDRDQQISEIFLKAIQLSGRERNACLEQLCADDHELRCEVQSLLAHHSAKELIETQDDRKQSTSNEIANDHPRLQPAHLIRKKHPAHWAGYFTVVPVIIVGVTILTLLVSKSVKRELQGNVKAQLQSMIDMDVATVEYWIANQMRLAENWAVHPDVQDSLANQALLSDSQGLTTAQLEQTESHAKFLRTIAPLLKEPGVKFVGVFADDGHGIAKCPQPPVDDVYWSSRGAGFIAPCFRGETVFIPSFQAGSNVIGSKWARQSPTISVVVPIRNPENKDIVAAMQINMRVDNHFADLFAVGRLGETGEAYAFDQQGLVLTNLRCESQLKKLGLIPQDATAALNLHLRDPSLDLRASAPKKPQVNDWPLSKVPGQAISAGQSIDVNGYRNYLGADVVGAAKWLPKYQFGIAREISYEEAYKPMRSLLWLFRFLLGLLLFSVVIIGVTLLKNWRLRRKVEDAIFLGQYQLGKCIGRGGMGQVFKANHALLRRPAAIKLIKADEVDNDSVRRFEREVQLTSELRHPNTIQIYDYGRDEDGVFYFAMEYLTGKTLSDLVASEGPVSSCRTVHILRQVCASLREAHEKGLLHRDIKPANIMICDQGGEKDFVKVLDFGLVKEIEDSGENEITRVRQLSGTPICIAPERIRDPLLLDPRSDIYSLGIVGYFMLTGRYPFDDRTTIDLLYQIVNGPDPTSLHISRGGVPAVLSDLIMQCLERDLENRPANMQVLVEALESLSIDLPYSSEEHKDDSHAPVLDLDPVVASRSSGN